MSATKKDKDKDQRQEVATAPPATGSNVAVPDFMKGTAGLGAEGLTQGDLEIPRIKLIQAISPEIDLFPVSAGEWWHTVAERSLGSVVRIVPVKTWTSVTLWAPRSDGGGILARAEDGQTWDRPNEEFTVRLKSNKVVAYNTRDNVAASGLLGFGTSDPADKSSSPAATRSINLLVYLLDAEDLSPAIVSFQRASEKVGRRFNSKIKMSSVRIPIFGRIYDLSNRKETSNEGDFLMPVVSDGSLVQDEGLFHNLRSLFSVFAEKTVRAAGDAGDEPEDRGSPEADNKAANQTAY
jgi:hypothetical protein